MDIPFSTTQLFPSTILLHNLFQCTIPVVTMAICLVTWSRRVPFVIYTMRLTSIARPRALDCIWGMRPGQPPIFGAVMDYLQGPVQRHHPPPFEGMLRQVPVDRNRPHPLALGARVQEAHRDLQQARDRQQFDNRGRRMTLEERNQALARVRAQVQVLARRDAAREEPVARRRAAPRAARR
jgi:hypothetical protein